MTIVTAGSRESARAKSPKLTMAMSVRPPWCSDLTTPRLALGFEENTALAASIVEGLTRFSDNRDTAALLGVASLVASQDEVSDAVALLGKVLCDAVAGRVPLSIERERLLAAADATTAAIRWLNVNADARMLVEQALAELVV